MSERNVDVLRGIYAEWARGNFRPRFDVYASDMEWGWSDEFPGLEGVGPDPVDRSDRLRQWLSGWTDWRCEAERYIAHEDRVVVLARYRGRGKTSGATVDTIGAHVWTLRDGEVVRLEIFSSREKALESAGLPAELP
jgi:ketosteroid isomerase-like protein